MTDGSIFLSDSGEWRRFFNIRDGLGIVQVRERGYKIAIITTSLAQDIRERAKRLKFDYFYEGAEDKISAFADLMKCSGLRADEIAYMGDDHMDIPVLAKCGFSAAPADAHPAAMAKAMYVARANGGRGAVRELCDLLLEKGPL